MGRPNCSRILAYSDAVSVAHRATPTASADSRVDIRARAAGPAQVGKHAVVAEFDGVGPHMRNGPEGIDALDRFDFQVGGIEDNPQFAAFDGHRQHQNRCLCGGGNGPDLTADHQAFTLAGGGQAGIDCIRPDGGAGGEGAQMLRVRVVRGDQRARDR